MIMIRTNNISFSYTDFDTPGELDPEDLELLVSAQKAALNAYAPYSKFKVGAAVRLQSGKIITGTNVENAAFPSGICAERNALSTASANHPGDIPVVIAIAAFTGEDFTDDPVSPCGNCRQVIAEEEYRNSGTIRLILGGSKKVRVIDKGEYLLPLQFNRDSLKITLR
jgi:cytidine deaminase